MTVEEGQASTDQKAINSQLAAETSRRRGRFRSGQPSTRHYGVCGKAGHNSRTCQANVEAYGEEYSD
jgi:hypothetical protein